MKIYPVLLTFSLLAFFSLNMHAQDDAQLNAMVQRKDYFRLRDVLNQNKMHLSPERALFYRVVIDNAFNQNDACIQNVANALSLYKELYPDSVKAALLLLQSDTYFKTFQYARAAETDDETLREYSSVLDENERENCRNNLLLRKALATTPAQQLNFTHEVTVHYTKDKIGLIEIPVQVNDSVYSSVFDTRANISTITKTYAKKLGLRMIDARYDIGSGATGNVFEGSLGVADSLYIGDILVQHAVFQVVADEILYIAPIKFTMNIIIGFPIIEQMKEVRINKDGTMIIPVHPTPSALHNLMLDELDPVVQCRTDQDTLNFLFDTGAASSTLYSNFYSSHKELVRAHGEKHKVETGGAGGTVKKKIYSLKNFNLYIGSKEVTLPEVDISTDPIPGNEEIFYGNLGQDVITPFDEMILNFTSMYLDFK